MQFAAKQNLSTDSPQESKDEHLKTNPLALSSPFPMQFFFSSTNVEKNFVYNDPSFPDELVQDGEGDTLFQEAGIQVLSRINFLCMKSAFENSSCATMNKPGFFQTMPGRRFFVLNTQEMNCHIVQFNFHDSLVRILEHFVLFERRHCKVTLVLRFPNPNKHWKTKNAEK